MEKAIFLLSLLFLAARPICAMVSVPSLVPTDESVVTLAQESTPTAVPTLEIREKITEPGSPEVKGKLEVLLDEQKLGKLTLTNPLKHAVRFAVSRGVPANTIVLILLLPLVAALVGFLLYFIGLSGFGTFMPAMIAVTLLATGIIGGLLLFAMILAATIITGRILQSFHLYYWPRRAITLLVISLITFFLLTLAPSLGLFDLARISIFPILFLILLSEEFTRVQLGRSRRRAISLTIGTLIISILGASLISWGYLQKLVLLNPEISFLAVLIINVFIGRYSGWRLLEYRRFKAIVKK